ncbi:hypothetical protein L1887_57566 [Cichorium endivia]|nr:hypothetical protein L1887_57566 [Cichorium endivia]
MHCSQRHRKGGGGHNTEHKLARLRARDGKEKRREHEREKEIARSEIWSPTRLVGGGLRAVSLELGAFRQHGGVFELVAVVGVARAVHAVEVRRPVLGERPLGHVELAVLEHVERAARVAAVHPRGGSAHAERGKRPAETAERRGEERAEHAKVVDVQAVGQAQQLDALLGAAVEGSSEQEYRQEAAHGATDRIDAVEEVELRHQTEQERRNASNGRKIGHEEHLEDVDVLDRQHHRRHIDQHQDRTAPPDVDAAEEDVVLDRRDLRRLERVVRRRTEAAGEHNHNARHPVGQRVDDVEERERSVVLGGRAVEQTCPPRQRTRHTHDEADGEERHSGKDDREVERLVVLGRKRALPEALVEHLAEDERGGEDVPQLATETLRLEQARRLDARVVDVEVDTHRDRGDHDKDHDDDRIDVVRVQRRLEAAVCGVDGRAERHDERRDGRVDTAEHVDRRSVRVEFNKHKAEHEADKDESREDTDRPAVPASDVLGQRKAVGADASDLGSEPAERPERSDGREAVCGQTEDACIRNDGQLRVAEEERRGHVCRTEKCTTR